MGEKRVGGAHLFFLHSLMGIFFFFFFRGHGPPKPLCGSVPGVEEGTNQTCIIKSYLKIINFKGVIFFMIFIDIHIICILYNQNWSLFPVKITILFYLLPVETIT